MPKPLGKKKPVTSKKSKAVDSPKGFCGKSPLKMIVFGVPGVGKSSFAANFPNPGFLIDPQETGIRTLVEFGQVKEPRSIEVVDNFSDTLSYLENLAADNANGLSTLVLDSLTGFEKLCFKHHCEENYGGDWTKEGFYSFNQGPKNAAKTDWPRLIDALDLVNGAGINVILLAHSQVKTFANPEGPDYERYIPYLDKESWQQINRWAQAVIFYNHYVNVVKDGARKKADGGTETRNLYTVWSPAYDAKNWFGLEPVIDAGTNGEEAYQAFKEAYLSATKSK